MIDAPDPVPAVCMLQSGIEEATAQCGVLGFQKDGINFLCFVDAQGNICFAGAIQNSELRVVALVMSDEREARRIDGVCISNPTTRKVGCAWIDNNREFVLVAQY